VAFFLMLLCWNQSAFKQNTINENRIDSVTKKLRDLRNVASEINGVASEFDTYNEKSQYISDFFSIRNSYSQLISIISQALDGACWLKSMEIKGDELYLVVSGYKDDIDEIKSEEKSAGEIILEKLASVDSKMGTGIFSTEKDDLKVESERENKDGVIGEIVLCLKLAKIPGILPGAAKTVEEEE
jgi:hypothetical protein